MVVSTTRRIRPRVLVELCAGTASVSLSALMGGRAVQPLTGYMGSKRRWAPALAKILCGGEVPDRVILVDAGPWGDVWTTLLDRDRRHQVACLLETWGVEDPHALWQALVREPPPEDPGLRVAQYLWLQARSAGTIPIWWDAQAPSSPLWDWPTGARTEPAHERGGDGSRRAGPAYEAGGLSRKRDEDGSRRVGRAAQKGLMAAVHRQKGGSRAPVELPWQGAGKSKSLGCRGMRSPATIAHRLRCLERLPWERIEVVHGDLRDVEPIPGADAYFDPPYAGCPRYAEICPRNDVLDVAQRWAAADARVVVSEGVPLDLPGWHSAKLPAGKTAVGGGGAVVREEWITANFPLHLQEQLSLWG